MQIIVNDVFRLVDWQNIKTLMKTITVFYSYEYVILLSLLKFASLGGINNILIFVMINGNDKR